MQNEIALAFENVDTLNDKNLNTNSFRPFNDQNSSIDYFENTRHGLQIEEIVTKPIQNQLKFEKHVSLS